MLSRRAPQRGVSLIELLVGLTVGLLVILGAMAMYLGASKSGRETVRTNRFNQDLRAVMDIMVSDLRRAGFSAQGAGGAANLFTAAATDIQMTNGRDCILFAYDTTWRTPANAGLNASIDFGGFRLSNGSVQSLNPNSGLATTATAACAVDNLWVDMTDANMIQVTSLLFDFGGSTCIVADPQVYKATAPGTYESWVTASPTVAAACAAAPPGTPASAATLLASGAFAEVRRITISMAGRTNDANAANRLVRQPLIETVHVRNHRMNLP